ncbi:MAG: ATP-binding protein [Pacificimonas sp.]
MTSTFLLAGAAWMIGAGQPVVGGLLAIIFVMFLPFLWGDRQTIVAPRQETSVETAAAPDAPEMLSPVLHLSDLGIAAALMDADGVIRAINGKARVLLGDTVGETMQLAFRNPDALAAAETAMLERREVVREIDTLGREAQVFQLRAAPTGDGNLLVTLTDVTAQRSAERSRTDFVANVSHELRTPLAAVIGFIETLQGPASSDEHARERFLGLMADESGRMIRLIDDLLSLSRIELNRNARPRTRINPHEALQSFQDRLLPGIDMHGKALVVEADEHLPDLLADQDQLLQLFGNLVGNAAKYGAPDTTITLEMRRTSDGLGVVVANEGDPIPSEHLPRLAERFYRVDSGRSRALGGTGLGLAIVKHIVERHRGRMTITSTAEEGTRVTITLPAFLRAEA